MQNQSSTVHIYTPTIPPSIQHAHVKQILDSVLSALTDQSTSSNNNRTFTYVETKFFSMWYTQLTPIKKQLVQHLVNTGRFTFVNGGWCMHDEATTHYMG